MDRWDNPFKANSANWSTPANSFGKAFSNLFNDKAGGIAQSFKSVSSGGTGIADTFRNLGGFAGSERLSQSAPPSSALNGGSFTPSVSPFSIRGAGATAGSTMNDIASGALGRGGGGKATRNAGFGQFGKTPEVWDYIDAAAQKYGVDANVMQVFMNRESSGDWAGNGNAGQTVHIGRSPWFDDIYPFIGTFKKTALSRGVTEQEWYAAAGNMGAQVDMLGKMLSSMKSQNGFSSPENLFAYYFSGQTDPNSTWSDGSLTVQQYVSNAMNELGMLGGPAGSGSSGFSGNSGSASMIWGGQGERDLSYGFNAQSSLGLYEYGAAYGLNGSNHTGTDIPMNIGEAVVSPVGGTIVCGGTGVGSGVDGGGGCAAFNDVMGQGAGRVEVQLDNGETVIFGHMSTSNFRPGQRINVGDVIGSAGGMNGGHVHLEWRVRDAGTSSGWRVVDPMSKLGGSTGMSSGGSSTPQQTTPSIYTPAKRFASGYNY